MVSTLPRVHRSFTLTVYTSPKAGVVSSKPTTASLPSSFLNPIYSVNLSVTRVRSLLPLNARLHLTLSPFRFGLRVKMRKPNS